MMISGCASVAPAKVSLAHVMYVTADGTHRAHDFSIMCRKVQFVAVMLVLTVLSAPMLAGVTCLGGSQPAAMPCCPAMAGTGTTLHLAPQHRGCCDVSNAKPSPIAALQSNVASVAAVSEVSSEAPSLAPATAQAGHRQSHSLRLPESPQSLLCVFLI